MPPCTVHTHVQLCCLTQIQSLDWEDPLEKGRTPIPVFLPRIPHRGAWGATVYGVAKSQTWLSDWITKTTSVHRTLPKKVEPAFECVGPRGKRFFEESHLPKNLNHLTSVCKHHSGDPISGILWMKSHKGASETVLLGGHPLDTRASHGPQPWAWAPELLMCSNPIG